MGVLKRVAKAIVDQAERVVTGSTERDVQSVEKAKDAADKRDGDKR